MVAGWEGDEVDHVEELKLPCCEEVVLTRILQRPARLIGHHNYSCATNHICGLCISLHKTVTLSIVIGQTLNRVHLLCFSRGAASSTFRSYEH